MGAYKISINRNCAVPLCVKTSVVEVFNRFNESRGRFCRRHGDSKLRELQRIEGVADVALKAER